jgi:hypothetical protein
MTRIKLKTVVPFKAISGIIQVDPKAPCTCRKYDVRWSESQNTSSDGSDPHGHMAVVTYGSGHIWQWSHMAVVTYGSDHIWQCSHTAVLTYGSGHIRQWSHMAVVTYGSGHIWQWSHVAVITCGSGHMWQWSLMAVVTYATWRVFVWYFSTSVRPSTRLAESHRDFWQILYLQKKKRQFPSKFFVSHV